MTWDKQTIQAILKTSQKFEMINGKPFYGADQKTGKFENRFLVYRMLQALYDRQWPDEKASDSTKYNNGQGFTSGDAKRLSKEAKKSKQYGNLQAWQAKSLAPRLMKYAGQIALVAKGYTTGKAVQPKVTAKDYISYNLAENEKWAEHKNEFAKLEAKQEEMAFMSGMKEAF